MLAIFDVRCCGCAVSEQLALGSDADAAEENVAAKSAKAKAPSGSKPTFLWLIRDHQVGCTVASLG